MFWAISHLGYKNGLSFLKDRNIIAFGPVNTTGLRQTFLFSVNFKYCFSHRTGKYRPLVAILYHKENFQNERGSKNLSVNELAYTRKGSCCIISEAQSTVGLYLLCSINMNADTHTLKTPKECCATGALLPSTNKSV